MLDTSLINHFDHSIISFDVITFSPKVNLKICNYIKQITQILYLHNIFIICHYCSTDIPHYLTELCSANIDCTRVVSKIRFPIFFRMKTCLFALNNVFLESLDFFLLIDIIAVVIKAFLHTVNHLFYA